MTGIDDAPRANDEEKSLISSALTGIAALTFGLGEFLPLRLDSASRSIDYRRILEMTSALGIRYPAILHEM